MVVGGKKLGELGEAKSCYDTHDIGIMAEVEIQTLVNWECLFVAV